MNFRLPFQISRVSAICQSSSAVNLISKFTPIYRNHVKIQNKDQQNSAFHTRIIANKCRYKTIHSPFNIYQQNAFIHDIADTEQAVKQRVRSEQKCDCQIPEEPKLAFRQTSKIKCFPCVDCKPYLAPPIIRPPKLYDDSKCLYKHKCNPDLCNINPPRKDDICCVKVKKLKLPPLPAASNCYPCMDKRPLIAPPLCPPQKLYDPDKMKWKHDNCEEPKCIRMDDACGFKVKQKELPTIPTNNCKPCIAFRPLTAPNMIRPLLRYDPTCIPYPHPNCPCDIDPPRRDSFFCEPMLKELPPMPCSDCIPCQPHVPTICPLLNRLEAKYDATDMAYKHVCPQSPCDTPALRRDNNIISVTLTRKKLPRIRDDKTCKPCIDYRPLTAPELGRPPCYNNALTEEQKRLHCIEEKCVRRDGIIKIARKCLPPVPTSDCCKPCMTHVPCSAPNFAPPEKLYDDTTCKYRHICIPEPCVENPPRMDDIKCYKITPKKLPKPPNSPDCKPCMEHPKTAPRLCPPRKCYDDTKQKYKHPYCPEDPCKTIPRADDITGIKDEAKCLQSYKPLKCQPCQPYVPCRAPVLRRPYARYDDTCMLYDHQNCPPPCDGAVFRRDHYVWEGPKKLPKVECGTICEPCQVVYPTSAPLLGRPQKLYEFPDDPVRVRECPPECPPRRDDILCWKPKRKKLPNFKDCDQCCYYSTIASCTNKKHIKLPADPKKHFEKKMLLQAKTDSKYYFSTDNIESFTKMPEKQKICKSKNASNENCNVEKKHGLSSTKSNQVQSESRYYLVKEPSWKCLDVSTDKTNAKKKYDYSVEKWVREGAEQRVKATSNSNSNKKHNYAYDRFDVHSKVSTGAECITPVKFTGYDASGYNEYLCIKKNNKLQPLKIGSAFKTDDCIQTSDNIACNKTRTKSTMCLTKDINTNLNKNKIIATSVPKVSRRQQAYSIIQERIKQHITPAGKLPRSSFILRLNNKMRSTLFQKISNYFKNRENAAKRRKVVNASRNRSGTIFERSKLNKELIANVCEKYDIDLNLDKRKTDKNKPYIVQKYKNKNLKIKLENASAMCCSSKLASKREEKSNIRSLPKNMKVKVDQIRNFSTNSNGGQLYYKHIDISDDYIGKIYKVKLKKIGVKNLMLEKNDPDKMEEEPHTICYICKVVPRYQPVIDDEPPDIENVKINYYKEKRNTID